MNIRLALLYVAAVVASLALAGLICATTQARKHIKAHGLIAGLMEWWLHGRESNWSKEPADLDDQWGPELKRAWERGARAELDAHRDTALVEGSGVAVAPRRLDTVKSIRLNSVELEHLATAAAKRGLTLGQYIKRAAIQQATDDNQAGTITATAGYGYVLANKR